MGFKYFFPAARGAYHRNQRGCFCGYGEWALRQKHVLGRNFCFLFKVNRFHHRRALVVFEMIWWWSPFSVYNQTVKNLILANFSHNSNIVKSIIVWPICFPASIGEIEVKRPSSFCWFVVVVKSRTDLLNRTEFRLQWSRFKVDGYLEERKKPKYYYQIKLYSVHCYN